MYKFKEKENQSKKDIIDKLCLGIDFGTTNSCISIWHKNKSIIISDIDGNDIIPTIIQINNDKKKIGKEAIINKNIFGKDKTFIVYEIKKIIGKRYSELGEHFINNLGFQIDKNDNDDILIYNEEENKVYRPEEIVTHLFMSFKTKAEIFLTDYFSEKVLIKDVVLSVPATFGNTQRQTIKKCAENAGFQLKRMINEPTAAALCYGLGKSEKDLKVMVYDFGGGTLDISIMEISDSVYHVLTSYGNSNFGGSDFDEEIMKFCIDKFIEDNYFEKDKEKNKYNYEKIENKKENEDKIQKIAEIKTGIFNKNHKNLQKLKFLSEQAKIKLSSENLVKVTIEDFYDSNKLSVSISRENYHKICKDLVYSFTNPIRESLNMLQYKREDIDEIIMVGGMTKSPIVRSNVELCKFFC